MAKPAGLPPQPLEI
ncbi:putative membrane protein, partial [Yersinia pestis PY-89]